jgi:hypothetical protein
MLRLRWEVEEACRQRELIIRLGKKLTLLRICSIKSKPITLFTIVYLLLLHSTNNISIYVQTSLAAIMLSSRYKDPNRLPSPNYRTHEQTSNSDYKIFTPFKNPKE